MDDEPAQLNSEPKIRGFHLLVAIPLSLWCMPWAVCNAYNYIALTWHLFSILKWTSFILLISPCFWLWIVLFLITALYPLQTVSVPWNKYKYPPMKNWFKPLLVLYILCAPPLAYFVLSHIGPYFYPVVLGGESGTNVLIRFLPILGGKGYN